MDQPSDSRFSGVALTGTKTVTPSERVALRTLNSCQKVMVREVHFAHFLRCTKVYEKYTTCKLNFQILIRLLFRVAFQMSKRDGPELKNKR